jgi:hypothetical protein
MGPAEASGRVAKNSCISLITVMSGGTKLSLLESVIKRLGDITPG